MTRLAALLRGVNLGPHRRVPMPELRALLTEQGFADVHTLLASGNVIATTDLLPDDAARAIEAAIERRFGLDVGVVVRTAQEIAAIVEHDPLGDVVDEPKRYQVAFLAEEPPAAAVEELLATDVAPEQVAARGREVYVWTREGVPNSRALAMIERLGPLVTVRNWNTVRKIDALLRSG